MRRLTYLLLILCLAAVGTGCKKEEHALDTVTTDTAATNTMPTDAMPTDTMATDTMATDTSTTSATDTSDYPPVPPTTDGTL